MMARLLMAVSSDFRNWLQVTGAKEAALSTLAALARRRGNLHRAAGAA